MSNLIQRVDGSYYDPDRLPIEIIPYDNPHWLGVGIYIRQGQKFVKSLEWEQVDSGSLTPSPVIRLDYDAAQALMNRLWIQGFRPKPSLSGASQEAALKAHLEDMRQLTFKLIDVDKPAIE